MKPVIDKGRILVVFIFMGMICLAFQSAAHADVCATVKIELLQEVTFERSAFEAKMVITNSLNIPLENMRIDLSIKNDLGNDAYPDFFVKMKSKDQIAAIDGTCAVEPDTRAQIQWLIIPSPGAAGDDPDGATFRIGATLSYIKDAVHEVISVTPDTIRVVPQPEFFLDYFIPGQVYGDDPYTSETEALVPYPLGVRVKNNGQGEAQNFKINTGQPKITDNDQGLLIGFEIIGSRVNDESGSGGFLVDFGTIGPGECGTAAWEMTCSLSGTFIGFNASFSHSDDLGGEQTSLIEGTATHLLVHEVLLEQADDDRVLDFLARLDDSPSSPLAVYSSQGSDLDVVDSSSQAAVTGAGDTFLITCPETSNPVYIKISDPRSGQYDIHSLMRSDFRAVNSQNVWLSKEYQVSTHTWLHYVNIFDLGTPGEYTLSYGEALTADSDEDGLTDARETELGTHPLNPDTDSDGILDGEEVKAGLNPLKFDTDGDGYGDGLEITCGTDPDDEDSMPVIYVDASNLSGMEDGSLEYPFNTIEEGIMNAPEFFAVLAAPGQYPETLTVDRSLVIKGAGPSETVVDAGGFTVGVRFSGSSVGPDAAFQGFMITNALDYGIACENGASPLIRNTIISGLAQGAQAGIYIDAVSGPKIFNTTISHNPDAVGILCLSETARIINNIITDNLIGIDCSAALSSAFIEFNNIWHNQISNLEACDPGLNNMSLNPEFYSPETKDFHLVYQSPCIDAGDMTKWLVQDYTGGTMISVDDPVCLFENDPVVITDGSRLERGFIEAVTNQDIFIGYPLVSEYTADYTSWLITLSSDYSNEPLPSGNRINMGAFGNTDEAAPTPDYCQCDIDGDNDVDGWEAGGIAKENPTPARISRLAHEFGNVSCPVPPPIEGDFDRDADVDGSDLSTLARDPMLLDLRLFSEQFGQDFR